MITKLNTVTTTEVVTRERQLHYLAVTRNFCDRYKGTTVRISSPFMGMTQSSEFKEIKVNVYSDVAVVTLWRSFVDFSQYEVPVNYVITFNENRTCDIVPFEKCNHVVSEHPIISTEDIYKTW